MKHAITICLPNSLLSMALVSQIPTEGMVGYWSFTGNADDESGNGNHGTVHGASLTEDRFGNSNSAYLFDGTNDRIYIGNNLLMQGDSISFSCWFKSETTGIPLSTGNRNTYLIRKSYSDSLRSQLYLSDATDGHGSYVGNCYASPDNWHHVVVTYDGQNHLMYLDGDIVDQTTNNGDVFSNQAVYLNFGVYQYGGNFDHWYDGIWKNRKH